MSQKIPRTVVIGGIVTIVAVLIIFILTKLLAGGEKQNTEQVSFSSADNCAACHRRVTPDIVEQFS